MDRERMLLELRYGIVDTRPRTFSEVGTAVGLSSVRIRQIAVSALQRPRQSGHIADLAAYLHEAPTGTSPHSP